MRRSRKSPNKLSSNKNRISHRDMLFTATPSEVSRSHSADVARSSDKLDTFIRQSLLDDLGTARQDGERNTGVSKADGGTDFKYETEDKSYTNVNSKRVTFREGVFPSSTEDARLLSNNSGIDEDQSRRFN